MNEITIKLKSKSRWQARTIKFDSLMLFKWLIFLFTASKKWTVHTISFKFTLNSLSTGY